jgi:outer membrane protein assembly factor BamB
MKRILILSVFALQMLAAAAQPSPKDWTKNFQGNINWYRITDAGVLAVATKDGLYGINPEDGNELWKQDDIENIKEENYDPIEGTPYIVLSKSGLVKNSIKILDVVTGKSLADSKDLGFMNIQKRLYLKTTNSILFLALVKQESQP